MAHARSLRAQSTCVESGSVTAVAESFAAPRASVSIAWIQRNWDIAILVLLAAVVFHPWSAVHLPLTDFGIFLAARGDSHSLLSQFAAIASNYMSGPAFLTGTIPVTRFASAALGRSPVATSVATAVNAASLRNRRLFVAIGQSPHRSSVVTIRPSFMGVPGRTGDARPRLLYED